MKKMDALKRPLKIPPAFGSYAEKKQVFQLYEVRECFKTQHRHTTHPLTHTHTAHAAGATDRQTRRSAAVLVRLPLQRERERYCSLVCACVSKLICPRPPLSPSLSLVPKVIVYGPPASGRYTIVSHTLLQPTKLHICLCLSICLPLTHTT